MPTDPARPVPPPLATLAALAARGFVLRRETEADRPFLQRLYVANRTEDPMLTGWPEAARNAFLPDQFRYQDQHCRALQGRAGFWLLERAGEPITDLCTLGLTMKLEWSNASSLDFEYDFAGSGRQFQDSTFRLSARKAF